ncbi:hypothetical protein GH714_017408 [Hevea brasiliensis]|uniref:Uncharacterized protein n=1 Tax=Hevea brasiliensis TaxID=3981 RepID=A0A6A6LQN4_HEVBR|nr:hypothetical protein GH714_017408 [Hevea brasiliensis]
MVLVASPDDCSGQRRVSRYRTRLQRIRIVRISTRTREDHFTDIVNDLVGILDSLEITKACLHVYSSPPRGGLRGCNNRSATRTQRLTQSADEEFSITEPKVKVPALLFMGAKDYVFKFTGI